MKPDAQRWFDRAVHHLGAAEALQGTEFYEESVFFCQQAVEVALKALWLEQSGDAVPPRTHNLVGLAARWDVGIAVETMDFVRRLSQQYTPSRYADADVEYTKDDVAYYLKGAKEFFAWLLPLLN